MKFWEKMVKEINDFDKKIDETNPFSAENYQKQPYSEFRKFYYPSKEHIMLWIDDE